MDALDLEHVAAILLIAGAALVASVEARRRPGAWVGFFSRALAIAILAGFVVDHVAAAERGIWTIERYLPLHLTDAVTIVSVLALLTLRPLLVELTYFWGLTASLQATLTPDLAQGAPDILYFTYFVTHGGAVVAAIFLVAGLRLVPRSGAVLRVFGVTVGFAAIAAIGNLATGGNYMWLREKPSSASLLDLMGPWPIYILTAAALALAMFYVLDTPFRRQRRAARGGVEPVAG